MSLIGLRRLSSSSFVQIFPFPIYSLPLFTLQTWQKAKGKKLSALPLLAHMGTSICVCSWMLECAQVCTVCVPSGASPALLACVAPAAVLCAGLHSWGEPWGRAAAGCTSPYPLFYSVSSRWAPLSDSTCNNTVTFLHLLLHPCPSFTLHHHHHHHYHWIRHIH